MPSVSPNTVRSAGCRSVTRSSAQRRAGTSSGPSSRIALGSWYMAVPGCSCSRNQIRRWAGVSGARRGAEGAGGFVPGAVLRSRSSTGSAASTFSFGTPKSTKQAISSAPASRRRRTVSAAVRSSPISARESQ
ncbi:hypothetical protein SVIOM74S_06947 [Streptomyces violarus]